MMRFAYGNGIDNGFGCGINGGGWFGMLFIGLLLIGLVIYLLYRLSKKTEIKNTVDSNESINILNLRFAKGEINEEEYKARKAAILK